MSEPTKEIAKISNEAIINKLADTFPENEQKEILRDMFIVTQIKKITVKEEYDDGNGYTKTRNVKRNMTPFESIAYVMLCRQLGFNPALQLVTMLEDNFYIGLDAHVLYAQSTGACLGIDAVMEEEKEIEYEKKEWQKGSKTPIVSKGKGKYYRFKCTVKKRIGEDVAEFTAIGIASPDNVTGGEKATDLKIMQMAEARATRRALKKAFPPGCGHIEDVTEMPDYNTAQIESPKEQPEMLENIKREVKPREKKVEEVIKEEIPEPQEEIAPKEELEINKPVPKEPKKEAKRMTDGMEDKVKKSHSAAMDDPRFAECFPEDKEAEEDANAPVEEVEDSTYEPAYEPIEEEHPTLTPEADHKRLSEERAEARESFKQLLSDYKANPTDETRDAKNDAANRVDEITQEMVNKGYAVI